ncbi:MAG: TldD/PmbA family protein [Spirochaetales bacterium]|nr:TldD/PmbA family protein [Spirochaetales bacterium]
MAKERNRVMEQPVPGDYLFNRKKLLAETLHLLAPHFSFVSVLGADDRGLSFFANPHETTVGEPFWTQRGFVFRAQREGMIAEYAWEGLDLDDPDSLAALARQNLEQSLAMPGMYRYAPLPDPEWHASWQASVKRDPFTCDPAEIISSLVDLQRNLQQHPFIVTAYSRYEAVHVSRMFLSPHRDLFQSFIWGQAYLFGIARRDDRQRLSYRSVSGLEGAELLDSLYGIVPELASELEELLDAISIEPGEYDVILDPDVAGTLAHEAFGHGVETDMFFKGRARAYEYLGKRVGSDLVTMYDGAQGVVQTGSYLFDDEGMPASRTMVIDHGMLVSGISDALSASALGLPATGNGRRQAVTHKAYARMTNTYFAPGDATLESMLASIRHGWYLSRVNSGMEDPINWGIQLLCLVGREIRDGRFTGRIASPVLCSGYVPDVLSAIDMVSSDFSLSGSGYCGKGYKEFVKVSSGGPHVKTRMRLG